MSLESSRRPLAASAVVLSALLFASCADNRTPVYPVKGTVLFNGKPAERAVVVFHPIDDKDPDAVHPVGHVEKDGTFTLTSFKSGDGAPAGEYAVTVDWRAPVKDFESAAPPPSLIPTRYNAPTSSKLRVTVKPGTNELEPIRLTR